MKIDVSGGYNVYRKNVQDSAAAAKSGAAKNAGKTDVAQFSHGKTAIADKGLLTLKSNIQRDVSLPATPERIEKLRTDVRNGTYRIPTEALVDSILGD